MIVLHVYLELRCKLQMYKPRHINTAHIALAATIDLITFHCGQFCFYYKKYGRIQKTVKEQDSFEFFLALGIYIFGLGTP